jgi:hypothetical protein
MPTTKKFVVNQPPQFTLNGTQIVSVLLIGQHIFTHMTQIKIDSNGSGPTHGDLNKNAFLGTIDATETEFSQVCNAVVNMAQGQTRTLDILGTENPTDFVVSSVFVEVAGASHVRDLLVAQSTATG